MGKEDDLLTAGREGDVPAILKSLQEGADVNCKVGTGDYAVSAVASLLPFLSHFLFLFFSRAVPLRCLNACTHTHHHGRTHGTTHT